MNIGHDRHRTFRDNLPQRAGACFVRSRDADNVGTRHSTSLHLVNGCGNISGQCVGHGLHRYWRIAADQNFAHTNLSRRTPVNVAPWTNRVQRHGKGLFAFCLQHQLALACQHSNLCRNKADYSEGIMVGVSISTVASTDTNLARSTSPVGSANA